MTASDTLRAALNKYGLAQSVNPFPPHTGAAILEAMAQHRAEALDEVEKWAKNKWKYRYGSATVYKSSVHSALSKFLAALKTNQHGNI